MSCKSTQRCYLCYLGRFIHSQRCPELSQPGDTELCPSPDTTQTNACKLAELRTELQHCSAPRPSPDNVGVVGLAELLEQGDLPQHGHGHAVLRQRELHLLDGHDLVTQGVPGFVHRPVGSWEETMDITEEQRKQGNSLEGGGDWIKGERDDGEGGESTRLSLVSSMLRR